MTKNLDSSETSAQRKKGEKYINETCGFYNKIDNFDNLKPFELFLRKKNVDGKI